MARGTGDERWLTPGVRGIGAASLLADLGHEVPTALLPSLLTSTLGAPASALGLIEGVADGLAGVTRFAAADADENGRNVARGSAFGLLATTQRFGNLAASAVVGLLYTLVSPSFAFGYASVIMVAALIVVANIPRRMVPRDAGTKQVLSFNAFLAGANGHRDKHMSRENVVNCATGDGVKRTRTAWPLQRHLVIDTCRQGTDIPSQLS